MKDKLFTIILIVIFICFIPVFITIILNGHTMQKSPSNNLIKVSYNGETLALELEEYIKGVVAAEMPASYESEALKAQAVCARTYTIKHLNENNDLVFNEQLQSYVDDETLKKRWGQEDFMKYMLRIEEAILSTKGEIIIYDSEPISAVFHAISPGHTRDAVSLWGNEVPYLVKADSLYDEKSKNYHHHYEFEKDKFIQQLGLAQAGTYDEVINSLDIDENGYVKSITILGKSVGGELFRKKMALASSNFTIQESHDKIIIDTKGYGHGVGLSQFGANQLALLGKKYDEIIKHYYHQVEIKVMEK